MKVLKNGSKKKKKESVTENKKMERRREARRSKYEPGKKKKLTNTTDLRRHVRLWSRCRRMMERFLKQTNKKPIQTKK